MSKIAAYEAPQVSELGSVHDLTMALKGKKLAFAVDFVQKKKKIIITVGTTAR